MNVTLSRRHLVGAGSLAGLAVAAVSGVSCQANAASPPPSSTDGLVLAACARFERAHAEMERTAHDESVRDEVVCGIGQEWNAAVDAILEFSSPKTAAGRIALARAARLAFIDEASAGSGLRHFEEIATREQRITAMALSAVAGA